jgi:hypothetical protein
MENWMERLKNKLMDKTIKASFKMDKSMDKANLNGHVAVGMMDNSKAIYYMDKESYTKQDQNLHMRDYFKKDICMVK